jgi:fructose-1,6-bisphosphatase I
MHRVTTQPSKPYSLKQYLSESGIPNSLTEVVLKIADAGIETQSILNQAGLNDACGAANTINSHGEACQKLDLISNTIFKTHLFSSNHVAVIASEEETDIILPSTPHWTPADGVAVLMDPLDGSSNIDVNVNVGSIFSIYPMSTLSPLGACLQPGRSQLAAGYILYGPSTMLIMTFKSGVVGFTLDTRSGAFFLSHPTITIPEPPRYYSVNEGNIAQHFPNQRHLIDHLKTHGLSARYIGSLVADFHRNLLKGGVYLYPQIKSNPKGKLRLLYEGNPLALICQQAGGWAINGPSSILDITPTEIHERTPLFIGNSPLVQDIQNYLSSHPVDQCTVSSKPITN